jgi:hypothetical protein
VAVAVLTLLGVGTAVAAEPGRANPYVASYPFQSAVIRYHLRTEIGHGPVRGGPAPRKALGRGTQVISIKGDRLAKATRQDGAHTLEIYTPDHVYSIDLLRRTGTRIDNPKKPGRLAWAGLSDGEKAAFHARLQARGVRSFDLPYLGRKVGTEKVLNERCDVYALAEQPGPSPIPGGQGVSMKTCVWVGGIPLRAVRESFLRREEMVATKIERNVRIPDSTFVPPSGVTITHDAARSEVERRHALARFELFRSGTPIVVRIPAEPQGAGPSRQPLGRPPGPPPVSTSGGPR